jgi:hypothetical protein
MKETPRRITVSSSFYEISTDPAGKKGNEIEGGVTPLPFLLYSMLLYRYLKIT